MSVWTHFTVMNLLWGDHVFHEDKNCTCVLLSDYLSATLCLRFQSVWHFSEDLTSSTFISTNLFKKCLLNYAHILSRKNFSYFKQLTSHTHCQNKDWFIEKMFSIFLSPGIHFFPFCTLRWFYLSFLSSHWFRKLPDCVICSEQRTFHQDIGNQPKRSINLPEPKRKRHFSRPRNTKGPELWTRTNQKEYRAVMNCFIYQIKVK